MSALPKTIYRFGLPSPIPGNPKKTYEHLLQDLAEYKSFDDIATDEIHMKAVVSAFLKQLNTRDQEEYIQEGTYDVLPTLIMQALSENITADEFKDQMLEALFNYCSKRIEDDFDEELRRGSFY